MTEEWKKEDFAPGAKMIYTGNTDIVPDNCTILEVTKDEGDIWDMLVRIRHDDSGKEEIVNSFELEKELYRKRITLDLTFSDEECYIDFLQDLEEGGAHLKKYYPGLLKVELDEE